MQTTTVGRNEGRDLFARTGFDKRYWASVRGARALSRISSIVAVPPTIDLPTDRPAIIAANHSSLFDLVASLVVLGHYGVNARIGVNKRFFANPASGAFLRGIGCIAFAKGDGGRAEDQMVEALLSGQAAAIMPEGRITRPDDQVNGVGPGRPGVSRIARKSGAAIVPVGFAHSDWAWVPGTSLPKVKLGRQSVIASIGPPILLEADDDVANANFLMSRISELVLYGREHGRPMLPA